MMPAGMRLWLAIVLLALASTVVLAFAGSTVAATTAVAPRVVTARGDLATDEKSTIALF